MELIVIDVCRNYSSTSVKIFLQHLKEIAALYRLHNNEIRNSLKNYLSVTEEMVRTEEKRASG